MWISPRLVLEDLMGAVEVGPGFPLRHISKLLGREYHITNSKKAGKFYIRPNATDDQAFIQVFQRRQFDFSAHGQFPWVLSAFDSIMKSGRIPVIIDAGANVGAASIWFSQQFPGARIVAVEPDPGNAHMCRLNTRSISNVNVIEAAIGSEHGRVSLANPLNEAWSVRTHRNDDGKIAIFTIPELVSTVKGPAQLFLAKIDVEGFEVDLFSKNTEWLDVVTVLIVEPHDWLFPGERTSANFQTALATRKFEVLIRGDNLIYLRTPEPVCTQS
jgi:FkbM family methyltransferase